MTRETSYFTFCLCLEDFVADQPLIIHKELRRESCLGVILCGASLSSLLTLGKIKEYYILNKD